MRPIKILSGLLLTSAAASALAIKRSPDSDVVTPQGVRIIQKSYGIIA
jgi:hypothetical protein